MLMIANEPIEYFDYWLSMRIKNMKKSMAVNKFYKFAFTYFKFFFKFFFKFTISETVEFEGFIHRIG